MYRDRAQSVCELSSIGTNCTADLKQKTLVWIQVTTEYNNILKFPKGFTHLNPMGSFKFIIEYIFIFSGTHSSALMCYIKPIKGMHIFAFIFCILFSCDIQIHLYNYRNST